MTALLEQFGWESADMGGAVAARRIFAAGGAPAASPYVLTLVGEAWEIAR